MELLTLCQKGNPTAFPLKWKDQSPVSLAGFFQKSSHLYLLLSREEVADGTPSPFFIGRYDLLEKKLEATAQIGVPARIYSPVASKISVGDDDIALVAWIGHLTGDLILSRWRPNDAQVRHERIAKKVGWNASVSINRIDDNILVAWHTDGKVSTLHVTLRHLSFKHPVGTSIVARKSSRTKPEATSSDFTRTE